MNIASLILITISLFIFFLGFRKNSDIFHPARLWICLWSLVIGVTLLNLSNLQFTWFIKSWSVLLLGIIAFPLGVLVQSYRFRYHQLLPVPLEIMGLKRSGARRAIKQVIILLFVVYIISYFIEWKIMGYLPLFEIERETGRAEWGVFGLHLLVSSIPIILALISEFFIGFKTSITNKLLYGTIFLIVLLTYVFLLNRLFIFMWAFMFAVQLHYIRKKINYKHLIVFTLILTGVFVGIGNMRATQFVGNFIYNISDMKYSKEYANLSGPYMYVVMNLENTARGVEKLTHHAYGAITLDFIYAILQVKRPIAEYLNLDKYQYMATSLFNTFTYQWYFYWDFGLAGVILGSIIWGYITGGLYYRMRIKPTLLRINMFSLTIFTVFLSFFTFLPMMLTTVYLFILLYFVSKHIDNPGTFVRKTYE
ncbi:MAG: oligosaccharide repeat unit polymerase [Bacteroidetes bacterium]|nr:oligosaccharide repeat unit polymerase [Bacteroidota bacterium]